MSQIQRKLAQLRDVQVQAITENAMVVMWETLLKAPFKQRVKNAWKLLRGKTNK